MPLEYYKGKKVLITGHTGFKGSWMCRALLEAGADITGYALDPPSDPSLYQLCNIDSEIDSIHGDVRDIDALRASFRRARPEIVIHMAAQPIVRYGYHHPVETYSTNVMGTVNLLECAAASDSVASIVNVTTDKVYAQSHAGTSPGADAPRSCREHDALGGIDPYSSSKACSELITSCYRASYLDGRDIPVSTVRSGNTIGGGDFGDDRLIPDCIRAYLSGRPVAIRSPRSSRPYQHVLESVFGYLHVAERQMQDHTLAGAYNIGPAYGSVTNAELASRLCDALDISCDTGSAAYPSTQDIDDTRATDMLETDILQLDTSLAEQRLGISSVMTLDDAIHEIEGFVRAYESGGDITEHMDLWISRYIQASH